MTAFFSRSLARMIVCTTASISCMVLLAGCENTAPVTSSEELAQNHTPAPAEQNTADEILEAAHITPPQPDPCETLGDLIRETKPETALTTPGNYKERADVKAFAQQVSACHNLDLAWVLDTLGQAQYQASTAKFIMPQPSGTRNWQNFKGRFIQANRVQAGVKFWRQNHEWLERAEATYGVPADIVMGILGVETVFGQFTGNHRIIDALATLAFDFPQGRSDRTDYFASELAYYLVFTARENVPPLSVRGSYAGAMGMPQFMPSSLLNYGVDFDGDGKIDLHNSTPDIIGSVANYLAAHGWQRGLPPTLPILFQEASQESLEALLKPDIVPTFTIQELERHGVLVDASADENMDMAHTKLAFIALENGTDLPPDYIAGTQNFFVITRYNRSSFYAMVVVEMGNAIAKAYAGNTPSKVAVPH